MKEIHVHQVVTNSDLTEGRGSPVVIANFTKREDAEIVKIGKGVMGSDGDVKEAVIRIFDTLDEYQNLTGDFPREVIERVKKTALSKLSQREKTILGL